MIIMIAIYIWKNNVFDIQYSTIVSSLDQWLFDCVMCQPGGNLCFGWQHWIVLLYTIWGGKKAPCAAKNSSNKLLVLQKTAVISCLSLAILILSMFDLSDSLSMMLMEQYLNQSGLNLILVLEDFFHCYYLCYWLQKRFFSFSKILKRAFAFCRCGFSFHKFILCSSENAQCLFKLMCPPNSASFPLAQDSNIPWQQPLLLHPAMFSYTLNIQLNLFILVISK